MLTPDMFKTAKIHGKPGYYAITPALAEQLLTGNLNNRRASPHHVDTLTRAMQNGDWSEFGVPILVGDNGVLLDGQHRLLAIIASGTTQILHIRWNIAPHVQRLVDTGNPRTAGQQAGMEGWKHGNAVASVTRLLVPLRGDFGPYLAGPRFRKLSITEVLRFADAHRARMVRAVDTAVAIRSALPVNLSAVGAVNFQLDELASRHDVPILASDVEAFFRGVREGVNLNAGHPVLILRNTLTRLRAAQARRDAVDHLYYLTRAWNATANGETISKFQRPERYTPDNFVLKGDIL